MPTAPRRQGPWLGAMAVVLAGSCLAAGWWIGQLRSGSAAGGSSRPALERQAEQLRRRLDTGEASPAEQQRLLELLVALERKAEATPLLERLADQQPDRWSLRLLLAELRRDQNDRSGAERELRQLLNQRPDQVEGLQLMALILLETNRGAQAQAQVEAALKRATSPNLRSDAVPIGLLLANVIQRRGDIGKAEAQLIKLTTQFPKDPRPLLARALLQQERGDTKAAQQTLALAKQLGGKDAEDPRLDQVAAAWGLEQLRVKPLKGPSPGTPPAKPSPSGSP
ncbi:MULTISPECIES: tetratricopeptide repeat protein [Aphanothece]|uniref:tetratricopeptide repeat protein n=1 Tax=Aphanothece TaxID=1121 RepID=UPI00398EB1B1